MRRSCQTRSSSRRCRTFTVPSFTTLSRCSIVPYISRRTFILAGMDTTSNALSRILHLLAQHPEVQDKLRAELIEARGGPGGQTDTPYDELVKLPYLDAVCRETLRAFAPVTLSGRVSVPFPLLQRLVCDSLLHWCSDMHDWQGD